MIAAALLLAAVCVADDPTPAVEWDQALPAGGPGVAKTVLYRVFWQRPGDTFWRGSKDFPAWHGDELSFPSLPGITLPFPVQRAIPDAVQLEEVNIVVFAVAAGNIQSAPSNIYRVCTPRLVQLRPPQ